jgi:hypothetical protein
VAWLPEAAETNMWQTEYFELKKKTFFVLYVHESVHRDTTMKVTKKMQLYRLIYSSESALHVWAKFSSIIRSS